MADPRCWGPHLWYIMHTIAYNYPSKNVSDDCKNATRGFYMNLKKTIPCKFCRESYNQFVKRLPIDNFLISRRSLTKWVYQIHEMVNDKLNIDPSERPSLKEVDDKYKQCRK